MHWKKWDNTNLSELLFQTMCNTQDSYTFLVYTQLIFSWLEGVFLHKTLILEIDLKGGQSEGMAIIQPKETLTSAF